MGVEFVDLSQESKPYGLSETDENDSKQRREILSFTHDALLLVSMVLKFKRDKDLIIELNKKLSELLLAHGAANPGILNEEEHNHINGLSLRSQPGLPEVLNYGTFLYVSIVSRIKTQYYLNLMNLQDLNLYKKNFLDEYCRALQSFTEHKDISSLVTLQALSKSFLDQGNARLDEELEEVGMYARSIYAFCNSNLNDAAESKDFDIKTLDFLLRNLKLLSAKIELRVTKG